MVVFPPIHRSCIDGDLDGVISLVNQGMDVNLKTDWRLTPLHVAACNGRFEICKFLIEKGADVNARTTKRETAFYFAVEKENLDLCRFLVDKGANPRIDPLCLETSIFLAARNGNQKLCEFLMSFGISPMKPNPSYSDLSTLTAVVGAAMGGHLDLLRWFVSTNKNFASKNKKFFYDIFRKGTEDVAVYVFGLLELVPVPNSGRHDYLCLAASKGWNKFVTMLLERGDSPNRSFADAGYYDEKNTPLHFAAASGNLEVCKTLFRFGIKYVDQLNSVKSTALCLAIQNGHYEVSKFLLENGAKLGKGNRRMEFMFDAARYQTPDMLKLLLEHGATLGEFVNRSGYTLLHHATLYKAKETCHFLIENGMDVDITNGDNETPLFLCIYTLNDFGMANEFVRWGANWRNRNNYGEIPIVKDGRLRSMSKPFDALAFYYFRGMRVRYEMDRKGRTLEQMLQCHETLKPVLTLMRRLDNFHFVRSLLLFKCTA